MLVKVLQLTAPIVTVHPHNELKIRSALTEQIVEVKNTKGRMDELIILFHLLNILKVVIDRKSCCPIWILIVWNNFLEQGTNKQ